MDTKEFDRLYEHEKEKLEKHIQKFRGLPGVIVHEKPSTEQTEESAKNGNAVFGSYRYFDDGYYYYNIFDFSRNKNVIFKTYFDKKSLIEHLKNEHIYTLYFGNTATKIRGHILDVKYLDYLDRKALNTCPEIYAPSKD